MHKLDFLFLFLSSLPKLKEDVNQLLIDCNAELGNLPAPVTSDPQIEILEHVTKFCTALDDAVYGRGRDNSLAQTDRTI